MKRILCIVGSMNAGGAETFLMKIYREIDKTEYQMDFAVAVREKGAYDDEIRSLGGEILYTVPKSKGIIKSFMTTKKIVSENQYKYVMRVSQHSLSGLELLGAKMGGATTTIFRSSNTQTGGGKFNRALHKIFLPITMLIPDIKIAPSTEAAEFMFGRNSIKKNKVLILPNALDTYVYSFNEEERDRYRKKLQIENSYVIGHVGRFSNQKNHDFLIDIFYEIKKQKSNAVLLLIGKGENESKIKEKVHRLKLEESVIFMGVRQDIPSLLSAMDLFLFPSFFEGMPNTVIEAQTSGLQCLISDSITKEAGVTNLVKFMPLQKSSQEWAEEALKFSKVSNTERKKFKDEMKRNGYDIREISKVFINKVFLEN